ncbi:hypothetical protein ACIA5D_34920 [Actinoplanes sp. NPDC051513]|uniref:hypothetical protein n=1 Tax=Actinoplanes sp. NPDC051513 TaxID=3363908 RepID=UPI0037B139A8
MTGPQLSSAPPPPPAAEGPRRRRWWFLGIVAGWIVVLAVLGTWSVWHSPASVPEQRDIAEAVPELQQAAGVVYAAAGKGGQVVVLGKLELIGDCRITPVRHGYMAARDLTVYVRQGEAETALEGIADALPSAYRAGVAVTRGGTRVGIHADAGNFIGIDSAADAVTKVVTLRLTSGCRPGPVERADKGDPAAGATPAEMTAVLHALGSEGTPEVRAVDCPGGGVAGSYTVDVPQPRNWQTLLRVAAGGAEIVRSDDGVWAYAKGSESVVVVSDGEKLRVSVNTGCQ